MPQTGNIFVIHLSNKGTSQEKYLGEHTRRCSRSSVLLRTQARTAMRRTIAGSLGKDIEQMASHISLVRVHIVTKTLGICEAVERKTKCVSTLQL